MWKYTYIIYQVGGCQKKIYQMQTQVQTHRIIVVLKKTHIWIDPLKEGPLLNETPEAPIQEHPQSKPLVTIYKTIRQNPSPSAIAQCMCALYK